MNLTITKVSILFSLIYLFSSFAYAQSSEEELTTALDKFVEETQSQIGMPGIALAVIKNHKVIYQTEKGFANVEHEVPLTKQSVFPLYSLTKPFIAVGVFSLIENHKLNLDDPISKYLTDLPETWKDIQIKHLLSHSSGLPDMAGENPYIIRDLNKKEAKERVFKLPLRFVKGAKYEYNQTNFWLLKEIIETVSKMSLSDFIIQHQFPNADKANVFFSSDARDIIKHRVTPYFPWVKGKLMIDLNYTNGDYFYACNGFHLTLDEFIAWDNRFRKNELISEASKKMMWNLFKYTDSDKSFSFAWEITQFKGKQGYGFSGAMTTFYRVYPDENLSVIFLSNGFSKMYSQDALIDSLMGIIFD